MGQTVAGQGGRRAKGAEEAAPRPRSRAREITSRGDLPTPEGMFLTAYAAGCDILTGSIDGKELNGLCRAYNTATAIARSYDPLAAMCDLVAESEDGRRRREEDTRELARQERKAQLLAELAELEGDGKAERPLPQKG